MLKYLCFLFFIPAAYCSTITPVVVLSPNERMGEVIITNDTNMPQNYMLTVDETSFPDKDVKVLAKHSNDIRLSQTMLYLSAGQKQKIQIRDKGVREHERYFLVRAQEQISKKNQVYATAIASRIFIRPDSPMLKYQFDGNTIKNDGNGYIMLMVDKKCGALEGLTKLIKPGDSYLLPKVSADMQVSIEFNGQIKELVNKCKK